MFRSIRWRLVISYALLTLLTVSLVGLLTLSLMKQYLNQRETEDLTANAESVARQAVPLMWPVRRASALRELAHTSAFLGNVQVRILDRRRQVLADSGSPAGVDRFMWLTPPPELDVDPLAQTWMMVTPSNWPVAVDAMQDMPLFEQLSSDAGWTIVHVERVSGVWGSRFTFEELYGGGQFPLLSLGDDIQPSQSPPDKGTTLRSERVITLPVGDADDPLGYVELSSSPDFGAEALAATRRVLLFAGGGAMSLALIVGLLVSHSLTAPLRSLTATAHCMSDDLSARASVRGRDEIGRLAQQLNHMAERLQASFGALTAERDTLRRFIADASHELRTPLTALRNFNELLQGAAADDPPARDEFLAESAVQLDRLEWITRNLLDMSRLDAGLVALDLDDHNVGELVASAAAPFRVLARDKKILFAIRPPASPVTLCCDRARVEMALSNLLDNAFKFASQGGQVEIGAEQTAAGVQLWVQDDGPGVDPADRPHIFERFYRGRGNRTKGSGLGLAIVQSVVQAHGGHVWVESEPGAGTRFVIALPGGPDVAMIQELMTES